MALTVRSTRERVVKLFIGTILCFGLIPWCFYDAFYKETMSESSKAFNLYAMPVLAVLGLFALRSAVRATRLRIEADEQTGISVNGRDPILWKAIEDVDTSCLAKKGRLYLKYKDSQNKSASLTLDEYNLDFFDELYTMIRNKLGLPIPSEKGSAPPSTSSGQA